MILFEKFLCRETNLLVSFYIKIKFRINHSFRKDYMNYHLMSYNLKYMFIIDKAENEIKNDKQFPEIDQSNLFDQVELDVLNYLDAAYLK